MKSGTRLSLRGHAEVFAISDCPIIKNFSARFWQRNLVTTDKFVKIVFESIFAMRVSRLCDVAFRPKIIDDICAA
jgi:hypothetical protein